VVGPHRPGADDIHFLSLLSEETRRRVLEGSTQMVFPAGMIAFRRDGPNVSFVVDRGLARVFATVEDGRQATVTFVHENELGGATAIASPRPNVQIQTVIESTLTMLDMERLRNLAASDNEVCAAIAAHLSGRVQAAFKLLAVRSLGTIKERVAWDLLDRSCQSQLTVGRLEAYARHADLADDIGSSREVVSRALGELRAAGIVETVPGIVRVIQPLGLSAIVRGFQF
jgi:CRP-like cAMP-binding protein